MHPPADVEPASVSQGEQSLSSIAMENMSAARAVSRLVKLIFRMESITGRASYDVMSTCSTSVESSSALVLVLGAGAFIALESQSSNARPMCFTHPGRSDRMGMFRDQPALQLACLA